MLYKVYDTGGVLRPSSIPVTSLGRIAKEGRVAHIGRWLPMPISGVPWEVSDEPRLKNPKDWWFFTWLYVLDQPERRPVAVLGKDPNQSVPFERDGGVMRAGSLNLASPGYFFEFQGARGGVCYLGDQIHPFRGCGLADFFFADPVPLLRFVIGGGWVPRNACDDQLSV